MASEEAKRADLLPVAKSAKQPRMAMGIGGRRIVHANIGAISFSAAGVRDI